MKNEPWRGNPTLRVLHLEKKLCNKKRRIAELEAELAQQAKLAGAFRLAGVKFIGEENMAVLEKTALAETEDTQ